MTQKEIQEVIQKLLAHLGAKCESVDVVERDGGLVFSVTSPDSHILIGSNGAHLSALNHLVRKLVSVKMGAEADVPTRISVDVNKYREGAEGHLKDLAKIMGERARSFKVDVELEPMSSYERMVIHSFFEGATDLKTESKGDGERRRVVIKYLEPTSN